MSINPSAAGSLVTDIILDDTLLACEVYRNEGSGPSSYLSRPVLSEQSSNLTGVHGKI